MAMKEPPCDVDFVVSPAAHHEAVMKPGGRGRAPSLEEKVARLAKIVRRELGDLVSVRVYKVAGAKRPRFNKVSEEGPPRK